MFSEQASYVIPRIMLLEMTRQAAPAEWLLKMFHVEHFDDRPRAVAPACPYRPWLRSPINTAADPRRGVVAVLASFL